MSKNRTKMTKTRLFREVIFNLVRIVCIVLIVYSLVGYVKNFNNREDSKYTTFILQAGLMFILTFVEITFKKLFKINLPISIQISFLIFCTCSILLGEIAEFYVRFSWWDDVLHVFSGGFVCELGVLLVIFLNEKRDIPVRMSAGFIVFFAFLLSMSVASIWEIFEYTVDRFTNSNMQRAYNSVKFLEVGRKVNDIHSADFNAKVGRYALDDTMGDIIECLIGTIAVCIFSFWDLKRDKDLDKDIVEKTEENNMDAESIPNNDDNVEQNVENETIKIEKEE